MHKQLAPNEQARKDMLGTFLKAWISCENPGRLKETEEVGKLKRIWGHAKEQLAHMLSKGGVS